MKLTEECGSHCYYQGTIEGNNVKEKEHLQDLYQKEFLVLDVGNSFNLRTLQKYLKDYSSSYSIHQQDTQETDKRFCPIPIKI